MHVFIGCEFCYGVSTPNISAASLRIWAPGEAAGLSDSPSSIFFL